MEVVGNLGDAQFGGSQQEGSLHEQHLVDVVDDGAACDLSDNAGEIDGRDVEHGGVEGDVVVLGKVAWQYTDEADEDFLDALGRLAVYDGTSLGVLQVEQEDGVEHAKHFTFIYMVGLQIGDDFAHFHEQMLCGIGGQGLFRLMQLHDGQVGQMYEVVDGWRLDGDVFICHKTATVKVVGGGDDGDGEAWRIDVQVVGVECQFSSIVMNLHPSLVNHHKGEAGQEPMKQVGTQDLRPICFQTVHPVIPALFGQIFAYKYRQIFLQ